MWEIGNNENGPHATCIKGGVKLKHSSWAYFAAALAAIAILSLSCGDSKKDLCNCITLEPDTADYRHVAKHIPLPNTTPQEITVNAILSWPQDLFVAPDAPRTGREVQLFHVAQAFIENANLNTGDCDIHLEISQIADKNAPRVIV